MHSNLNVNSLVKVRTLVYPLLVQIYTGNEKYIFFYCRALFVVAFSKLDSYVIIIEINFQ